MANRTSVIGWPRHTDQCAFQSGGAVAAYPAANLGTAELARVWRSADLVAANTWIAAVLPDAMPVRCLALVRHNLSVFGGRLRVRLYADAAMTTVIHDGGWESVWPEVYPIDMLDFEDPRLWFGTYTAREVDGYAWTRPVWLDQVYVPAAVRVDFEDPNNPAGYIEVGMFEIAHGWELSIGIERGSTYGWIGRSQVVETAGGVRHYDRRPKRRMFRGQVKYLPRDEALSQAFELYRQADIHTPFPWWPDPNAPLHYIRNTWLATLARLDPITLATPMADHVPLSLEEVP